MGYEIAGGLGVKMAAPERRRLRAGRRRLVPDDGAGDRHRGAGARSRSPSSCSTTTASPASAACRSRSAAAASARATASEMPATGELDGDAAAGRSRGQRRVARRARLARRHARRVPRRADAARGRRTRRRRSSSCRSIARRASAATTRGGTCRSPRCRRSPTFSERARGVRRRAAQGARLSVIRVANAPCSWGVLEFERRRPARARRRRCSTKWPPPATPAPSSATGGFCRPNRAALGGGRRPAAAWRSSAAFVPVALSRARRDRRRRSNARCATARLLAGGGRRATPLVAACSPTTTRASRTAPARAGRIRDEDGLSAAEWDAFARRAERVAARGPRRHRAAHGVSPSLRRLRRDAGRDRRADVAHRSRAARPVPRHRSPDVRRRRSGRRDRDSTATRIWHVHFKDCDPALAAQSRAEGWDYHTAVRRGIFCELGRGTVPFAGVLDALRAPRYAGWIVVEQDVLPGSRHAAASADRNRAVLFDVGLRDRSSSMLNPRTVRLHARRRSPLAVGGVVRRARRCRARGFRRSSDSPSTVSCWRATARPRCASSARCSSTSSTRPR